MFTVNHDVVNKRFIMHSWAGADGIATAEEKQKEKEYNAKYYQEHKKPVSGIRNSAPVSQPITPSPTAATPAQPTTQAPTAQPAQSSGKKKTSSGRSIGTKPKIDDDIVQASATHKRTEGDRDFDDSYKTEENRVVKDLDMFTHKTDDGNTVFVLGDNKWYLPKGIDLTDADKKLLIDLWNQPDKDLPDTKEHVMELFLQAKMQNARNGQKKEKKEKTEKSKKKSSSKKTSTKKTSSKKSKKSKETNNTEEESTVNTTETPTSSGPIAKKKTYVDYLPDAYEKQKIKHFDDPDPSDFIAHFGVMGQQHGVQNGPPYPLGSGDHSAREVLFAEKAGIKVGQSSGKGSMENIKKANSKGSKSGRKKTEEELRADAEKAMAKADPKKIIKNIDQLSTQELADASQRVNYKASIEKLIPEEAKKTKLQRDTEKAANSADANEILKYSTYMTPQQLTDAVSKMKTVNSLKASMRPKSTFEKIEDVADRAAKVKDIAEKGIGIWNTMAKVHNSIDEKEWPVINMGGEKKDDKSKDQKKNNGAVTPKDMMEFARILNSDRQQSRANSEKRAAMTAAKNESDEAEKLQKTKSPINNDSNDFTAKSWYNNDDVMDIKISDYKPYSPYYDKKTSKDSKKDSDDFLSNNWYNNDDVMDIKISDYKPSNNSTSSYDPDFDKWFKPSEDVSSGRAFDRAIANGSDDDILLTPRQLSRRNANYSDDYIEFLDRTPKSKK